MPPSAAHSARRLLAVLPMLAIACLSGCGVQTFGYPALGLRPASFAAQDVPAGYYEKSSGLRGPALMMALHDLSVQGQRDLGYDKARDLMFTSIDDPTGNGGIQCVYTGRTITGVTDHVSAYKQGFTTEHTWPQSLGAWGIAKDDLHAMYPADGHANTLRSTLPFGEVARQVTLLPMLGTDGETSRIGYAAGVSYHGQRMVFEPRTAHKGEAARALLYFYVRYALPAQKGGPLLTNFVIEEPTLIQWNREYPPTPTEVARNEAIFEAQGNRNPFVDHPEYVDAIGQFLPVPAPAAPASPPPAAPSAAPAA